MPKTPSTIATRTLGKTGRVVTRVAFGCYRVDDRVPPHREALERALDAGVTLIDTSTNYGDGHAEVLVGKTLQKLAASGPARREEITVVTKAGYVQGSNMRDARERIRQGRPFPEMTEFARDCWHCVSPEFLENQLDASLTRLQAKKVDVFLLHNPEYFLKDAAHRGVPLEEARDVFYDRIRRAFEALEAAADAGRIGSYGVSSNTFVVPRTEAEAVDLTRLLALAGPRFSVIQLPMNPLELGAREKHHTKDGKSVLDVAKEANLGVLVNRPLNAFGPQGLTRFAEASLPFEASAPPPFDAKEKLLELEATFRKRFAPRVKLEGTAESPADLLAVSGLLFEMAEKVPDLVTFTSLWEEHVEPRLEELLPSLTELLHDLPGFAAFAEELRARVLDVSLLAAARPLAREKERVARLETPLTRAFGGSGAGTVSQRTIRGLLATPGVDSVLVGMRRKRYVDDVVGTFA